MYLLNPSSIHIINCPWNHYVIWNQWGPFEKQHIFTDTLFNNLEKVGNLDPQHQLQVPLLDGDERLHFQRFALHSQCGVKTTISRVPICCWEMTRDRIISSVTRPPAFRKIWASPRARPSAGATWRRESMQVTIATCVFGLIGRWRSPCSST